MRTVKEERPDRRGLCLDQPAPDFEVMTTTGQLRLSDYQGRWVVLFAHPADFTPVCTSEIVSLSKLYGQFKNLNTEVIGLSLDSHFTHLAWLRSIERAFNLSVPFPIIDDQNRRVAEQYGMVASNSSSISTMRSTFIIDDEGRLRLMQHYPMWVGRSVEEILRVLSALQFADREAAAMPEGWQPGQAALALPAKNGENGNHQASVSEVISRWWESFHQGENKDAH